MRNAKTAIILTLSTFVLAASQSPALAREKAQDYRSLSALITDCASVQQDIPRLECYDSLSTELVKQHDVEPELDKLPEDIGGGQFDTRPKREELSRGLVVSCKKSLDKKWFFIFESGQVWKQVNADNRRYNYKGCNFKVTVKKDGFGYKMQIDGQDREIRIKRYK